MYRFSVLIEFAFGDGDGLAAYPAIESPICHDVALLSDGVSAQETRPSRVDGDTLCKSYFSRWVKWLFHVLTLGLNGKVNQCCSSFTISRGKQHD